MSYKVEPISNSAVNLGEGPHWDVESQSLYFVGLDEGLILRYDYKQDKVYRCQIENENFASFIIPIENTINKFIVGIERRVVIISWNGIADTCKVDKVLFEVEMDDEKCNGNRFNDAKCDPKGRLFAGTMRYVGDMFVHRYGNLYKYNPGDKPEIIKDDIGISNGLTWDENAKKFYFIDSTDFNVKSYDYDVNTGKVQNPKVIFDLNNSDPSKKLLPDGMTIDTDGNLYVATFNGSTIFKINAKTGKSELQIKLPVEQITSCAFGGPNLDILYVTTAAVGGKPTPAGTTYKVTGLGVKGLPMIKFSH